MDSNPEYGGITNGMDDDQLAKIAKNGKPNTETLVRELDIDMREGQAD